MAHPRLHLTHATRRAGAGSTASPSVWGLLLGILFTICGMALLTAYVADLAAPVNAADDGESRAWAAQEMTNPALIATPPQGGESHGLGPAASNRPAPDLDALTTPQLAAGDPPRLSGQFHGEGAWHGADVRATHLDLRQALVEIEAAARRQLGSPAVDDVSALPGSVNYGPR